MGLDLEDVLKTVHAHSQLQSQSESDSARLVFKTFESRYCKFKASYNSAKPRDRPNLLAQPIAPAPTAIPDAGVPPAPAAPDLVLENAVMRAQILDLKNDNEELRKELNTVETSMAIGAKSLLEIDNIKLPAPPSAAA